MANKAGLATSPGTWWCLHPCGRFRTPAHDTHVRVTHTFTSRLTIPINPTIPVNRSSLTYSSSTHPVSFLNTTPVYSGIAQHTDSEALRPLCRFLSAWWSIPGISDWLRNVIQNGHMLQFRRRPPRVWLRHTVRQCWGKRSSISSWNVR